MSALGIAGIGLKHFGNPIPQAWYSAAKELMLSAAPAPHPDTRKVVQQMVVALSGFVENVTSDQLDEVGMWGEYEAASSALAAGQKLLKKLP